ncbi:zinc finger FYVE domain-containing protein 26 homolog isoform X2 [Cephus cinctus]|nr:zinc finger FYVE domain-containing protein 26 homolog isoform X2 [Cephus cinctus]
MTFLEVNLQKNPALTCCLIQKLLCIWSPYFSKSDNDLQDLYINVLRSILGDEFLEECHDTENLLLSRPCKGRSILNDNDLATLLSILSKLELAESKENKLLVWLFPTLLRTCSSRDVELTFYSRKTTKYLKEWYRFLDETYATCKPANTLLDALRISKAIFNYDGDKVISLDARELLARVMKRESHWVIDILDICYTLTTHGRYHEVSSILSLPMLKYLWPALLFKFLNDCPNVQITSSAENWKKSVDICDMLKYLLDECNLNAWTDTTLDRLNLTLRNQLAAIRWIVNSKKTSFREGDSLDSVIKISKADQSLSVKQLLSLLQSHNILSVLHMTTDIHNKDFEEIKCLLKDSEKSVGIFEAYRAMLSALKAILFCEYYDTKFEEITMYLCDMEKHLQSLLPFSLRLETIENIFSMLFLRHEDFSDTDSNSEGGEDEPTLVSSDKELKQENKIANKYNSGFICNRYAVREILHHLKSVILAVGIDSAKLKRKTGHSEELEEIQKTISRISKLVADATWRLQLLTSSEFIQRFGTPSTETSQRILDNTEVLSNDKFHISSRLKQKAIFFTRDDSSSDESDLRSEVDAGSETGSAGNNSSNNGKRKRRFKNSTSNADSFGLNNLNQNSLIINFMLATKESFVVQCLWKNDYDKAQQVIEMFNMNNSRMDGVIQFSKALHMFRQEIEKQWDHVDVTDSPKTSSSISTLENIRLAAQGGIKSSRVTSLLETFLASQKANVRLINSEELSSNEILTMAVMDLALTTGRTHQVSMNLSDVAMKYLRMCKRLENTKHSLYFSRVYQLLYESKLERPLTDLLCDARVPLSVKAWKEKNEFWTELTQQLSAYKHSQNVNPDRRGKNNNYMPAQKCFKDIISLCGNGETYLQKVQAHLKLLRKIMPTSDSGDNEIRSETFMLNKSLDSYFGHQIFDLEVEPENLENIANRLQVNLVHSILMNCCPKLLCKNNVKSKKICSKWGCMILNKSTEETTLVNSDIQDPNKCVSEILSDLLQILRDLNPGQSTVKHNAMESISKNPNLQSVLSKTCQLATLDLSELSVGNETLTFFLNTWNLLLLHSILTVWADDQPYNDLRHDVSFMTVGYEIGDLGLVTLSALRYKLLGNLSWNSEFFPQTEELNELAWQDLDLTQDPRVIFAMANEFYGTPLARVFNADSLDEDLNSVARSYFNHYAQFEIEKDSSEESAVQNICWLPELVHRYQEYISRNSNPEGHTSSTAVNEHQISLDDYLNLFDKNPILRYKSLFYLYEIKLDYTKDTMSNEHFTQDNSNVSDEVDWSSRVIKPGLLQYLEEHCWLLSYLVQRIHEESPKISETKCDNLRRTACLENLLNSPWAKTLACLYNGNETLSGIQENVSANNLWICFETSLRNNKWLECLDIMNSLPDNLVKGNVKLQCFKDKILSRIISGQVDLPDNNILPYVHQITNIQILAQTILSNLNNWPVNVCEEALVHALHHSDKDKLPFHCKLEMNETLCRVTVFHRMLPYCTGETNAKSTTWYDVAYCTEKTDPVHIVKSLIDANKFELCLEWLECQAFSSEIQSLVTQDLLIGLLRNEQNDFKQASKLLQALPLSQSMKMCKAVLRRLESIPTLHFVIDYLLEHCNPTKTVKYQKASIGVNILSELDANDRVFYIHLIKEPLLMFEQLLMNGKFENLQRILNTIQVYLPQADISTENFDKIVRYYAGKSLDFRVALQRDGIENRPLEVSLSSTEGTTGEFVMPINVPTKEEWVPNDKARECSCCQTVIFSMFNRRHHCRRCGRVVCAMCSQQRMRVSGYPNSVLVRVCDDCKRQTVLQLQAAQGAPSTPSSEAFDCWRLTTDQTHNQTLREEFSFEHAPSISLCLAILNLHSDHEAYASFLLDRCDEMKRLLQPVSGGKVNPEIDHALIIKMIRSLVVAAKVKCAKLGLNIELVFCDQFLSQVDLITTLVQSDCLTLIPSDNLDEHALRRLRDLLTEKELWTLALDVSTKSGLDRQGVWAAWGKACLKVGCFEQARDKFTHCLDKVLYEGNDEWIFLPCPSEISGESNDNVVSTSKQPKAPDGKLESEAKNNLKIQKKHEILRNRPAKDPPLLSEILQILENLNLYDQSGIHDTRAKSTVAHEVLSTLNSLTALSQGQCNVSHSTSITKNIYYQESLYYLLMYGSHLSIMEFFVKHNEFEKCLAYTLENDIDPDLFFNGVYIRCLKNGCVERLYESMRAKDASLLLWKNYLVFACRSLERKQFLNTLYQLQIFMKDYVRASMTCIRFYTNDATTYTNLCSRSHLLVDAQKHLETELQVDNFSRSRRRSVSSGHSGHGSLIMEMEPSEIDRHVNTISRQMEITKFLGNAEKEGRVVNAFLDRLFDMGNDSSQNRELPTLFGHQQQKTQLAVLAILCGRDVEEGFGIAFRIMQDYNLRPEKVYSLAGHILALDKKLHSIEQLIKCCRSSGASDSYAISDRVLTHCVKILLNYTHADPSSTFKNEIDTLIRLIADIELKISSYIESRQLKAAYLFAVKHARAQDVRKILKEADRLGQNAIKSICIKWLQHTQKT